MGDTEQVVRCSSNRNSNRISNSNSNTRNAQIVSVCARRARSQACPYRSPSYSGWSHEFLKFFPCSGYLRNFACSATKLVPLQIVGGNAFWIIHLRMVTSAGAVVIGSEHQRQIPKK